mmetsp:Transcript_27796/g.65887  ORF Transcript_27796/g.65887 Transcript_27796/m.65887 type:complete len:116 (+) Transcript_27796:585-932(+)
MDTDLDDIDAETTAGIAALMQRDAKLDEDLEDISKGVKVLKNIAVDMKTEIELQNVMVDEIDAKVDKQVAHLQHLNAKVKDTIEKAGGVTRMIVNIILLIILVAVILYAARLVSN